LGEQNGLNEEKEESVNTGLIVTIVVVVVVVILLLAIFFAVRRSRARRLEQQRERSREEFGSEYDRTVQEKGSEEEADKELRRRRGSVERNVEPLSDERREHFEGQWGEVERVFVDNPERSIEMADRTVSDILHERRFITDSSQSDEETERNLAAMHPDVADDYREARRMRADVVARSGGSSGDEAGEQSTEDLRQTIQRYRAVYERIVER
jgi:FtsZ-interacting cell division protein ZipA